MIKYEDIVKANESIVTTTIKRKDKKTGEITAKEYAEVNQRIKAFRMVHPNGTISCDIINMQDDVVIMKATILDGEGRMIGSGYAYEIKGSSFINSTSYIENCETSAVGRALGMCGFGIDTSVASYEEVANAVQNQEQPPKQKPQKQPTEKKFIPATETQVAMIITLYNNDEISAMMKRMKKKDWKEVTIEEASKMIEARKGKMN